MPFAKRHDSTQRTDQMPLGLLLADCEQRVRRAAQRRDDDCRLPIETPFHDVGSALDCVRVPDRCPSELYDDHAESNAPFKASSSALSTDPPAAPRIVLWPRATIRRSRMASRRTRPTVTVIPAPALTSRLG